VEYIPQLDTITTEGMTIRDGKAIPSSKPGLGIAWNFEAIERLTVDGTHTIIV
jgi:L-alanine-DL-glutamate epimerase-like enolase superfamily enzyme